MLLNLPNSVLSSVIEKMDSWSVIQLSKVNRFLKNETKTYLDQSIEIIQKEQDIRSEALSACHKIICRIYNQNIIKGWCERCGREGLVYSCLKESEDETMFVCLDKFIHNCGLTFPNN